MNCAAILSQPGYLKTTNAGAKLGDPAACSTSEGFSNVFVQLRRLQEEVSTTLRFPSRVSKPDSRSVDPAQDAGYYVLALILFTHTIVFVFNCLMLKMTILEVAF